MKNVNIDSKINMKGIESQRTYFFKKNKKITLNNPLTLQINSDGSHTLELENGMTTVIEKDWLAFSAETPVNDFSFNVNADNDVWFDLIENQKTTYLFDDFSYFIENAVKLNIRKSGSHSIVDKQGKIHYIKSGFQTCIIDF